MAALASSTDAIAARAEPLPPVDDPDFARAFDRYADARVVLLGEASHGTSEFHRARAAITRRLVKEHGFAIVAVEADWPDAAAVNRRVRGRPARPELGRPFARFPTWMWRNAEVDALVRWMEEWNRGRGLDAQVGFYGLDLYNLGDATRAVVDYLDRVDPQAAQVARDRYGCLTPFCDDPARYGRRAWTQGYADCEEKVVGMLLDLFSRAMVDGSAGDEDFLDAAQNARLVANAEAYYRVMFRGSEESWNLRDTHMADTLDLGPDRLERFIGVIYRPETERWSHYSETSLSREYDGWVWREKTRAVAPLPGAEDACDGSADETWPFGV